MDVLWYMAYIIYVSATKILFQYITKYYISMVLTSMMDHFSILNPHFLFFLSLNTSFTTLSQSNVLEEDDDEEALFDDDVEVLATSPEVENIPVRKVVFLLSFQESYSELQTFPFEFPFSEPYLESLLFLAILYPELL